MNFAGMNPVAIGIAAVAAFLWGALYYRIVGTAWMRAGRLDPATTRPTVTLFLTTLTAEAIIAWVLAGTLGHLGVGQVTLKNGLISALFVWFGFMATTLTVNHRFQGFGWGLVLADAVHWLGAALIMGAVIGGIGV